MSKHDERQINSSERRRFDEIKFKGKADEVKDNDTVILFWKIAIV